MLYSESDFILRGDFLDDLSKKQIKTEAPSNIALVKYWGKHGVQLPLNPSVSFTLNRSKTNTEVLLTPLNSPSDPVKFQFFLDRVHRSDFEPKIAGFFKKITLFVPFIHHYEWKIYSQNTFPHSSGIASSASAFAALSKIIIDLEKELFPGKPADYYAAKTSFIARLGSGSAARSTDRPVMIWGHHPDIPESNDLYAVKPKISVHPAFQNYQDTIILVEKGVKKVSSSKGHQLMNTHPYKEIRKKQAFDHSYQILEILKKGDLQAFIDLTESEALTLHALMMTSSPGYILMMPGTLQIINQIRKIRQEQHIPVCFTLDAGANVHILYPETYQKALKTQLFDTLSYDMIFDYV
jgi:diphosphomevalonate decarboxylase